MIYVIATIKQGTRYIGFRLLDTVTKETREIEYNRLLGIVINDKKAVENVRVEGDKLVALHGSFSQYTALDKDLQVKGDKSIVLLGKTFENMIAYAEYNGNINAESNAGILKYHKEVRDLSTGFTGLANCEVKDDRIRLPLRTHRSLISKKELIDKYLIKCNELGIRDFEFNTSNNGNSIILTKANVNIREAVIPKFVDMIGVGAFSKRQSLVSVKIPNVVRVINEEAFSGCTSLTKVVLPDSVEVIGKKAFLHCSNLREINMSKNIRDIYMGAFAECVKLEEIVLPRKVDEITEGTFYLCENLRVIRIEGKIRNIENRVFPVNNRIKFYINNNETGELLIKAGIGRNQIEYIRGK